MISRDFSRFWAAGAVSGLGTYVTLFALQAIVVLTLDGTAGDVGWLNAARWLPYLLLGLLIGALVDGRRRLPLLIGTDLLQAVLLLLVPLLWWLDALSLPALLVIVVAYGTASVVGMAASMSFLPRLVGRDQLLPAHARIDGADAVSSTAGPALAGVLVGVIGAPLTVLVDSASYLWSALVLRRIEVEEPPARTGVTVRGILRDIGDGVRWAYGGSGLRLLAVTTHVAFVGYAVLGVALAPYAYLALDLGALAFGLVGAVGGVGAVLGASITTAVGRRLGTGRTIIACHLLSAAGVALMALAGAVGGPAVVLLAAGQALFGIASGMSNAHETSYRQLVTPDELQARTNTTLRSANRAVIVVVAPLAGLLGDAYGLRTMLVVTAVVFAGVGVTLAATSFRTVRAPA